MLIGIALLTALDYLVDAGVTAKTCEIRNIGSILCLYLEFAMAFGEACTTNEDGWDSAVVRRADQHYVKIQGASITMDAVQTFRANMDTQDDEEDSDDEHQMEEQLPWNERYPTLSKGHNCVRAYIPPRSKFVLESGESLPRSETRSWHAWDWKQEVRLLAINSLQFGLTF